MKFANPSLAVFVLALLAAGSAQALPALPEIPLALPDGVRQSLIVKRQPLAQRKLALIDEGNAITRECGRIVKGSAQHQACLARLAQFDAKGELLSKDMDKLEDEIDAAVAGERKRLEARGKELEERIRVDLIAVRNLGFDRRTQDFEEWEKLASDARLEFQHTISAEATSLIADKAKDGILSGVKKLDEAKVGGWIEVLMKQDPPPTEIIAVLRRMASVADADRVKLATDAKYLATLIKDVAKSAKLTGWREGLPVLLEIVCDGLPSGTSAQCKLFRASASVTAGSLYNNAARRVAQAEVERLTSLNESQLKDLARLNTLLEKHVKERREVTSKLKELQQ